MSTGKTDNIERHEGAWVLYDGACPMCRGLARRYEGLLKRYGSALEPLQTPWVQERLGLRPDDVLTEMKLLTSDNRVLGGVDAYIHMATTIWWAKPLGIFASLPGVKETLSRAYRWFAARRYCFGGTCRI